MPDFYKENIRRLTLIFLCFKPNSFHVIFLKIFPAPHRVTYGIMNVYHKPSVTNILLSIFPDNGVVVNVDERIIDISVKPCFINTKQMDSVGIIVNKDRNIVNFVSEVTYIQVPDGQPVVSFYSSRHIL